MRKQPTERLLAHKYLRNIMHHIKDVHADLLTHEALYFFKKTVIPQPVKPRLPTKQ